MVFSGTIASAAAFAGIVIGCFDATRDSTQALM